MKKLQPRSVRRRFFLLFLLLAHNDVSFLLSVFSSQRRFVPRSRIFSSPPAKGNERTKNKNDSSLQARSPSEILFSLTRVSAPESYRKTVPPSKNLTPSKLTLDQHETSVLQFCSSSHFRDKLPVRASRSRHNRLFIPLAKSPSPVSRTTKLEETWYLCRVFSACSCFRPGKH